MYVTDHAADRIEERLTLREGRRAMLLLEAEYGVPGTVAYIAARLKSPVMCEDGSNGDTLIAVAVEGSVETIMFRRSSNQSMDAHHFGARKVVDLC